MLSNGGGPLPVIGTIVCSSHAHPPPVCLDAELCWFAASQADACTVVEHHVESTACPALFLIISRGEGWVWIGSPLESGCLEAAL